MGTIKTIIQSAVLKSAANLTAQLSARWHQQITHPVDWQLVAEFAVFGVIQAQLNIWWQRFLEDSFPTRTQSRDRPGLKSGEKETSSASTSTQGQILWINVILKLILDQTLGLFIMNSTFLICTNAVRLQSWALILELVREKIFHVIRAAWKVWPMVSICNFLWVPVESRVLVGALVGFGWNIFLAFFSMTKQ